MRAAHIASALVRLGPTVGSNFRRSLVFYRIKAKYVDIVDRCVVGLMRDPSVGHLPLVLISLLHHLHSSELTGPALSKFDNEHFFNCARQTNTYYRSAYGEYILFDNDTML